MIPAKTSCAVLKYGPGAVVAKLGKISVRVVSAASTAKAALAPWTWNPCSWWRAPPHSKHSPTIPLQTIITAANTVSRARAAFPVGTAIITDTISATSITVTATASTSVPNGSPVRCATTSAWCTAVNTAAHSAAPTSASNSALPGIAYAAPSTTHAITGAAMVQRGKTDEGADMRASFGLLVEARTAQHCP